MCLYAALCFVFTFAHVFVLTTVLHTIHCCCFMQVDAVKRQCIKELPPHLILHLKRFEFDLDTLRRKKVNDHFVIPDRLNLKPFTEEGIMAAEAELKPEVHALLKCYESCSVCLTKGYRFVALPESPVFDRVVILKYYSLKTTDFLAVIRNFLFVHPAVCS